MKYVTLKCFQVNDALWWFHFKHLPACLCFGFRHFVQIPNVKLEIIIYSISDESQCLLFYSSIFLQIIYIYDIDITMIYSSVFNSYKNVEWMCFFFYCNILYCWKMMPFLFFKWFSLAVINEYIYICILMAHCCWWSLKVRNF